MNMEFEFELITFCAESKGPNFTKEEVIIIGKQLDEVGKVFYVEEDELFHRIN